MKKFLLMALVAMLPAATFAQEEEDTENGVVSVAGKEGFKIATKKGDFVFKPYMMVQASGNFNYYDDEGLDALAGIAPTDYTEAQHQALREVFSTLQEKDVPGWCRSLQLRNILLPPDIREEALLIVRERRKQ